jgi:hypothetical protein
LVHWQLKAVSLSGDETDLIINLGGSKSENLWLIHRKQALENLEINKETLNSKRLEVRVGRTLFKKHFPELLGLICLLAFL